MVQYGTWDACLQNNLTFLNSVHFNTFPLPEGLKFVQSLQFIQDPEADIFFGSSCDTHLVHDALASAHISNR